MRNNRIPWPNVVTRRAAVEPTGAVTCYRGVRSNNNNNSHAALAERFQSITLHELQQLGLYTNTDTPNTAHQLDVEAVAAEVDYTTTNTQLSCSGGGESDRIPNTFKEAMDLPQVARWKAAAGKKIATLKKPDVFQLVSITPVPARYKVFGTK